MYEILDTEGNLTGNSFTEFINVMAALTQCPETWTFIFVYKDSPLYSIIEDDLLLSVHLN